MDLKRVLAVGLLAGLGSLVVGCPIGNNDPVFIQDHALESAIRASIYKPFGILTEQDMLEVRRLDGKSLNISNLSGLEYCQNLAWADLDTNDITDLTPLEQLGRPENPFSSPLVYLNLDSNGITDITALAGLLNLQGISLFDNQIADIGPLVTNALNGGLGPGDYVVLDYDTMNEEAIDVDVPVLLALGVNVIGATAVK